MGPDHHQGQVRTGTWPQKGQSCYDGDFSLLHTGRRKFMAGTCPSPEGRRGGTRSPGILLTWGLMSPPHPATTLHKLSTCRPGTGVTEAATEVKRRWQGAHTVAHK